MIPPLAPYLHELIRKADQGVLGSLETPAGVLSNADGAVLSYAARYAMSGNPEHVERLAEILEWAHVAAAKAEEAGAQKLNEGEPYDVTGLTFRPCRSCRTPITFVTSANGKKLPVTREGISHYKDCDAPKRFSEAAA